MKGKLLLVALFCLLAAGCAGASEVKPPTCDVYVQGNQVMVVINLPAEGLDYTSRHDLTPPGFTGTPSKMTIDGGGSSVNYSKTGNNYEINYNVVYERGEIASYDIFIKGDVYGEVEHTCHK